MAKRSEAQGQTQAEQVQVKITGNVLHNGETLEIGKIFPFSKKEAQHIVASGAGELVAEETSADSGE